MNSNKNKLKIVEEWLNANAFLIHEINNGGKEKMLGYREIIHDIKFSEVIPKDLNILADSPEFLSNKQVIRAVNLNNTTKGVNATTEVNILARRLQADWMVENSYVEEKIFGNEQN